VDLGFDHYWCSEAFCCVDCFLHGERDSAIGDGHAELFEELFALVFEEVHAGAPVLAVRKEMRLPYEFDILGGVKR
jgi:hypothetical protein